METDPLYIEVTNKDGDLILTGDNVTEEEVVAAQVLAVSQGGDVTVYETDNFGNTLRILKAE